MIAKIVYFGFLALSLLSFFSINEVAMAQNNKEINKEIAILAGGCFWCLQGPFDAQKGVLETQVGYTGGSKELANYRAVSTGKTGHYEAIKVIFDPAVVSYQQLLDLFWRQIDPTQADGQFADIGPQYRSAIFYTSDEQKKTAEAAVALLAASGKFTAPIATEIKVASEFYVAEDDHQTYYKKAPEQYKRYKSGSGRADFIQKNWEQK